MQTFLPYPSFNESAACLDNKRLGEQRVHVLQIINALDKTQSKGWKSHPVTKMWEGYPVALINYGLAICDEWISRDRKDSVRAKLVDRFIDGEFMHTLGPNGYITNVWTDIEIYHLPPWFGREDVHASHRASLLLKDPEWYSKFGWTETPSKNYVWPV